MGPNEPDASEVKFAILDEVDRYRRCIFIGYGDHFRPGFHRFKFGAERLADHLSCIVFGLWLIEIGLIGLLTYPGRKLDAVLTARWEEFRDAD